MHVTARTLFASVLIAGSTWGAGVAAESAADNIDNLRADARPPDAAIELGARPLLLIDAMDDGPLKTRLQSCARGPFYRTDFSIGHRGAPLQFPEHTREGYESAARQGAGAVECDATFTSDGELVCRHSECDLHLTTNIVDTPLNASCTRPWNGRGSMPKCCTSDLTLQQFKTLHGKVQRSNPDASTAGGYVGGTASRRTDHYSGPGTLLTLEESIELNERLGVKHVPELKGGDSARIDRIFGGQANYAQKLVDTLLAEGVDPNDVRLQSFDIDDVLYWIERAPAFGKRAAYLDDVDVSAVPPVPRLTPAELQDLYRLGVRILAPPMPALLAIDANGAIVPSQYAMDIKSAGLDIITWTFERADLRNGAAHAGFYYTFDPTGVAIKKDADMYKALDVLAAKVGILGIFSDWPATVTYYANCMGLK